MKSFPSDDVLRPDMFSIIQITGNLIMPIFIATNMSGLFGVVS